MTKNLKISPEEAARLIKQNGESELLTAEEIASGLRDHVEEFGPNELMTGGITYTVWAEDES